MNPLLLSLLLILLSGFFQGTFGLGMKRFSPVWEAYWLVFSIAGMLVIPVIWAGLTVPDVGGAIKSLSLAEGLTTTFFGLCWGITALMFGISIKYLGVSLSFGIAMGISAAVGSLVPLFRIRDFTVHPSTPYIIVGNVILLIGVYLITRAGQIREKMQSDEMKEKALMQGGKFFRIGLILAIFSGIGSSLLNIGFVSADPAVKAAVAQGAKPQNASLVAWIVVLSGGFIASLVYCIYLFIKNKSFRVLRDRTEVKRILKWSLTTAVLWFAALGIYGQGAALMGEMGPVVGWAMFMALALIISNLWGVYSGEWKGAGKSVRILVLGDGVLLASWIIMAYANSFMN